MKIVINTCFGGFGLSEEAYKELGLVWDKFGYAFRYDSFEDGSRTDPRLVAVVEKLGTKASGPYSNLKVVEIPDGIEYEIDNYDGKETIHEKHRHWG